MRNLTILSSGIILLFSLASYAQTPPAGPTEPAAGSEVPAPTDGAAPAPKALTVLDPATSDPRVVMAAVESKVRANQTKGRMAIRIIDRSGRTRERTVRSWAMDADGAQRQLMIFDSPADVRGTSLLSIDHDNASQDDDQWLFLPSLKKTTRISSGDRSGSFMGTDLTYADMTRADTTQYEYKMLKQTASVGGEECWLIESRPKTQKAKDETGYVKVHGWVSKKKMMILQVKAWVREGRKLKYIKFDEVKMLGGQWTPFKISARTVRGRTVESTTIIQFADMTADNPSVTRALFDQNTQWWTR